MRFIKVYDITDENPDNWYLADIEIEFDEWERPRGYLSDWWFWHKNKSVSYYFWWIKIHIKGLYNKYKSDKLKCAEF